MCELSDRADFVRLWSKYLMHLDKRGSILPANETTLGLYTDLWQNIVTGNMVGISLIIPDTAVCLWGPALPIPTKLGRAIQGQGTFVREERRGEGIGSRMYDVGFAALRDMGFSLFIGAVDGGNIEGVRNAKRLGGEPFQLSEFVRL